MTHGAIMASAVAKLAKELANRVRVRAHTGRVMQGTGKFRHCDVAILCNDFNEAGAMRIELSVASGATLRSYSGLAGAPNCKPPPRSGRRRKLQTQRRGAPAQPFFDQFLKPRLKRIRQRC